MPMETVTALPSAVTVKAEAGGRVNSCRSSEKVNVMSSPAGLTPASVSVGGVVSASTTMLNSVADRAAVAWSSAITFTTTVSTSVAAGVPLKVRVSASKPSHVGSDVSSRLRSPCRSACRRCPYR